MPVPTFLLFAAEVTPLTPAALYTGGALGVCLIFAGIIMIIRKFRRNNRSTDVHGATALPALDSPWRIFSAMLMVVLGTTMLAGVIIDPRFQPRLFLYVWTAAIGLVLMLMMVALLDLMTVRRKAYLERFRLREKHKAALREDLRAHQQQTGNDGKHLLN